jgi:hypothetical protein
MFFREPLARDGIVCVPHVLSPEAADDWIRYLAPLVGDGAGERRLHEDPRVWEFAADGAPAELARQCLGQARVVRILFFDKHAGANWKVPYHQDVTIAVRDRADVGGFTGWSDKAGMTHVRAPAAVLENMLAVRIHLDECGPENGPLRAIPGSHSQGRLKADVVKQLLAEGREQTYTSPKGGAILMRPLTLHASSQASSPSHRRVLHIEYAAIDLPAPLQWAL